MSTISELGKDNCKKITNKNPVSHALYYEKKNALVKRRDEVP